MQDLHQQFGAVGHNVLEPNLHGQAAAVVLAEAPAAPPGFYANQEQPPGHPDKEQPPQPSAVQAPYQQLGAYERNSHGQAAFVEDEGQPFVVEESPAGALGSSNGSKHREYPHFGDSLPPLGQEWL